MKRVICGLRRSAEMGRRRMDVRFYSLKYNARQWLVDHGYSLLDFMDLEMLLAAVADEENQ